MPSKNGSLCLGKSTSKSSVVQRCKDWLASGDLGSLGGRGGGDEPISVGVPNMWKSAEDEELRIWLDSVWVWAARNLEADGTHVNITDCEALETAIDDSCDFDLEPVKAFTRKVQKSDGYTIAFWVKAMGDESLNDESQFLPHLSLLHSISPPIPYFSMGTYTSISNNVAFVGSEALYTCVRRASDQKPCSARCWQREVFSGTQDDEPYYECECGPVRTLSECKALLPDYTNVEPAETTFELGDLSSSEWTFIAYSIEHVKVTDRNRQNPIGFAMQNSKIVARNLGYGLRDSGDPRAFFEAIEVSTPTNILPIPARMSSGPRA